MIAQPPRRDGGRKVRVSVGTGTSGAGGALNQSPPIHRRFVIDILTGSSAGGINGIFLAKALANNQNLDELKRLWIEKGDIAQLYNDGKHAKDVNLKAERPPTSLLDGRWMYAN